MLLNLPASQRDVGVIAASAGNHALALSYHGQMLDINVTVVMPKTAPIMKVQNCKVYGANVIVAGADLGEVSSMYTLTITITAYVLYNLSREQQCAGQPLH